jgi:hypothetical protein
LRVTYRDNLDAARLRRESLSRELADVRARIGDRDALVDKERQLAAELEDTQAHIDVSAVAAGTVASAAVLLLSGGESTRAKSDYNYGMTGGTGVPTTPYVQGGSARSPEMNVDAWGLEPVETPEHMRAEMARTGGPQPPTPTSTKPAR